MPHGLVVRVKHHVCFPIFEGFVRIANFVVGEHKVMIMDREEVAVGVPVVLAGLHLHLLDALQATLQQLGDVVHLVSVKGRQGTKTNYFN